MNTTRAWNVIWALMGLAAASTAAGVNIDLVPVGNAGNAGDSQVMSDGTSGYGSVDYGYQIGKFEVTAGQYCDFLNAVARTDTYYLYSESMSVLVNHGCMIARNGNDGEYSYSVAPDWADRPVNYVSWGSAARFCNWLANGQPTGPQELGTTEDGSYYLNGAFYQEDLLAVVRKPNATWVLPSEDEWYKAAFHKNNGTTGDYWDFATSSDSPPDNGNPGGDSGNSANFYDAELTIGAPYHRTPVGFFSNSASPYGTYDQNGNVQEWNEALVDGDYRGVRGGYYYDQGSRFLRASARFAGICYSPTSQTGFRVALVPEPASAALVMTSLGFLALCRRRP